MLVGLVTALSLAGCSDFVDKPDAGDAAIDAADGTGEVGDGSVADADAAAPDGSDGGDDGDAADATDAPGPDADVPQDDGPDAPTDVVTDTPIDAGDGCTNDCPLGDKRCVNAQTVETCVTGADGCTEWGAEESCPSPDLCQGPITCVGNGNTASCEEDTGQAVVCAPGTPCIFETCNPATGQCEQSSPGPGGLCDDGDPCTPISICDNALNCKGDPDDGLCPCSQDSDCDPFDDGNKCNGTYTCGSGGACELQDPLSGTCSPNVDPCLNNVCDPPTGTCVPAPGPDGVVCPNEGSDMCVLSSQCISGVCEPNVLNQCTDSTPGLCEVATCDPSTGNCSVSPEANCCGNGTQEGTEQCDDSNDTPDDGCSPTCELPTCDSRSATLGGGCVGLVQAGLVPDILSFTIELWLKVSSGNVGPSTIAAMRPDTGGEGWALELDASSNLQMRLTDVTGTEYVAAGPQVGVDAWVHVRVARDGDTTHFWLDGTSGTTATAPIGLSNVAGSDLLTIGCSNTASQPLVASIDDLWIRSSVVGTGGSDFTVPTTPPTADGTTVLLHHFDETAPGVSPSSASGFPLVWTGSVSTTEDDPFGGALTDGICPSFCANGALQLTGSQSLLANPTDAAALETANALTVEFWYRNTSLNPGVLMAYRSAAQGWSIQQFEDNGDVKLGWLEEYSGGSSQWNSPTLPKDAAWHHIAMTRTLDGNLATVTYFVDGTGAPPESKPAGAYPSAGQLHIGTLDGTLLPAEYDLDDLRITADVVYDADFTVTPGNAKSRTGTLFMFGFNEGGGNSAYNAVVGSNGPAVNATELTWLIPGGVPTPCP